MHRVEGRIKAIEKRLRISDKDSEVTNIVICVKGGVKSRRVAVYVYAPIA